MKAQFDHSSLATSATATEREREIQRKKKIPITASKTAAANKQRDCLYLNTPRSISLELSLNLLHALL